MTALWTKKLIVIVGTMASASIAAQRIVLACRERGRSASIFFDGAWRYPDELARAMHALSDLVGAPSLLVCPPPDRLEQWLAYAREPHGAVLFAHADLGNMVFDVTSHDAVPIALRMDGGTPPPQPFYSECLTMDGNIQLTGQVLDPSASSLGDGQQVGSSRVDLQACKLEYSIVSPK